jgi:alpha-mannosidase
MIRACRIKLAVSEEKITELEDEGVQCPGKQVFEYALCFYQNNYNELTNKAAEYFAPVKCAVCGRGKGTLPKENSLWNLQNKNLHVTAIKQAKDGNGTIVRLFNPTEEPQTFTFGANCKSVEINTMAEEFKAAATLDNTVAPKKIMTYRVKF